MKYKILLQDYSGSFQSTKSQDGYRLIFLDPVVPVAQAKQTSPSWISTPSWPGLVPTTSTNGRLNGILVYTVYMSLISDVCRYDIKYIVSKTHFLLLHRSKMSTQLITLICRTIICNKHLVLKGKSLSYFTHGIQRSSSLSYLIILIELLQGYKRFTHTQPTTCHLGL